MQSLSRTVGNVERDGPAPAYTMSLSEEKRVALREYVRKKLPIAPDGSIHLIARAWAVLGARKK